jgi:flagellar capping protein FliD
MESLLGLEGGTYRGEDAEQSAGLAIRLDSFLESYTGIGGIIQGRVTTGGQIDREIGYLQDRIEAYEDRLAQYEERIRRQFIQMEMALAQFQQTSQFLSSRLSSTQSQQNNSGITSY